MKCDICGDSLKGLGPIGTATCGKCGQLPMCPACARVHSCTGTQLEDKPEGWTLAGCLDVDSGIIRLGDPCHGKPGDKLPEAVGEGVTPLRHKGGGLGKGLLVSGFGGDGCYPVYVRHGSEYDRCNDGYAVEKVMVDFTKMYWEEA